MRIQEIYPDAGRPVVYLPGLKSICGSVNAALFYSYLANWTGRQADPGGWIYKSADEITVETGLSYSEQKTARAKLRQRGLLQEKYRRYDHTLFFRLILEAAGSAPADPRGAESAGPEDQDSAVPNDATLPSRTSDGDAVEQSIAKFPNEGILRSRTRGSRISESANPAFPKEGFLRSLNGTSKSTTENTSEITHDAAVERTMGLRPAQFTTEWSILHGLPVSEQQLERERIGVEATSAFESALGVREWPWASTRVWEKMVALAAEAWKQDPDIFRRYAEWMEGEGKYKAMSVKQIRANPQQFIDTGWPLFLATRKPSEPEPVQGETDLMRRIREREARK